MLTLQDVYIDTLGKKSWNYVLLLLEAKHRRIQTHSRNKSFTLRVIPKFVGYQVHSNSSTF